MAGLKASQLKRLKKISDRRFPVEQIVSPEIARTMTELSAEINRQVGALVNRAGYVDYLIVGDTSQVFLPDLKRSRVAVNRFRGLRLVHTHLRNEKLTDDDITDLVILRLDLVAAITMTPNGLPELVHAAHVNPDPKAENWIIDLPSVHPAHLPDDFLLNIEEVESEFGRNQQQLYGVDKMPKAILVGLEITGERSNTPRRPLEDSIAEMEELCRTAGIKVASIHTQQRRAMDPRTVIGKGKLKDIVFESIRFGADLLIFDRELTPAQAKHLSDYSDLKIIDRTQLILDIFARNARSQDGKLQVELAQLRYLRSRLSEKDDNMSRLTGGIGGRGPGETKLEIGRRRVGERIALLEKQLKKLRSRRNLNRKERTKSGVAQMAIIGYTNAGKSTLLNSLTQSDVIAENKLFATLDPTTRRIRFPEDRELIVADTVGFIHELPQELVNAFKATLEELSLADLLLHVIDAGDAGYSQHIDAVETILGELELMDRPRLLVFNKADAVDPERIDYLQKRYPEAVFVSALKKEGLQSLVERIARIIYGLPLDMPTHSPKPAASIGRAASF